jgi:hypothetical protein
MSALAVPELKVWSVVHGFASLALDGLGSMPTAADRARALEATLEFTVVGLWGEPSVARAGADPASSETRPRNASLESSLARRHSGQEPA